MRKVVHINIGEVYASQLPAVISTILGSCIGVCLFDPVLKVGGMNHILLPGKADFSRFSAPTRYAVNAMELLINRIMALGGNRFRLRAKIFGGAHVITAVSDKHNPGKQNSEFVLRFLENENINIASMALGGRCARRVFFHTDTGDVYIKRIDPSALTNVIKKQEQYRKQIQKRANLPSEITLFHKQKL